MLKARSGVPSPTTCETRGSAQPTGSPVHERDARVLCGQPVDRRLDVVALAAPLVERALAAAHAPEVEPEGGEAELVERAGDAEDQLVVHRPAVQRVCVADDRRVRGSAPLRVARLVDRLEFPGRARDDRVASKKASAHVV
jgi:hypothetical protein